MAVTRAYAAFANGGYRIDPWFIARVEDRHGTVVMETQPLRACPRCAGQPGSGDPSGVVDGFNFGTLTPPARAAMADAADASAAADAGAAADGPVAAADAIAPRAIDPRTAFLVRSLLLDVVKRGTGTAARALGRADIGGKTGSTNDHRDAWFAGLGGDLVTTVWVGRDDFSPLGRGEYGGRAALPIWIDYMRVALEGVPVAAPEPPPGLLTVTIDPATGGLLPSGEPGGMIDYVKTEDYDRMVAGGFSTDGIEVKEEAFDVF
jgi:penicillin-binding protein 1A